MKKILVIEAHPKPQSFGAALASAYVEGAKEAGAEVQTLSLIDLSFDPYMLGFGAGQTLEPDLKRAQELIEATDHLVFQFPVWWGSLPALLKGFIDRTFLPGWAFRNVEGQALPDGLLAGRTARVISTMDSPWWWYWWKHGRAAHRTLAHATLHYVGINQVRATTIYSLRSLGAVDREAWLRTLREQGAADAR